MKISVVIPCYNGEATIERTLDSILAQEYNDLEVIIADDHSTDRTLELCHKYDDKLNMIYITTKPRGMHCPNNTRLDGFNATSYDSDWITFIDQDDVFVEKLFGAVVDLIEKDPEESIHPLVSTGCIAKIDDTEEVADSFEPASSCLLHGKFFDRAFLIEHDLTPRENIYIYEDIYFFQRFLAYCAVRGISFIAVQEIGYEWRLNKDSLSHWLEPYNIDFDYYYFDYWVAANSLPFFEMWEKYGNDNCRTALLSWASRALLGYYFLYMILIGTDDFYARMYRLKVKEALKAIIRIFNSDIEEVIIHALSDPEAYDSLRESTGRGRHTHFIETKTFYQFITDIWNDNYQDGDYIIKPFF